MSGEVCTHTAIVTDVPYQLWEAITTDGTGETPLLLTRALHNKPVQFFLNYARCYFHYLSPHYLSQQLTPYGFILLVLILYILWKKSPSLRLVIRYLALIYPLVFIFELQRTLL